MPLLVDFERLPFHQLFPNGSRELNEYRKRELIKAQTINLHYVRAVQSLLGIGCVSLPLRVDVENENGTKKVSFEFSEFNFAARSKEIRIFSYEFFASRVVCRKRYRLAAPVVHMAESRRSSGRDVKKTKWKRTLLKVYVRVWLLEQLRVDLSIPPRVV